MLNTSGWQTLKKNKKFAFYRRMFFVRFFTTSTDSFSPDSNNRLVFIMDMDYGICQVGTELLYTLQFTSRSVFKGQSIECYCRVIYERIINKSLPQPTSRRRRTESIVSLERGVCSFAELQVFSCYRGWREACQATRAISTTWRREPYVLVRTDRFRLAEGCFNS